MNINYISCEGISSAGKTTICKILSKYGYTCIQTDALWQKATNLFYENVKNEFMTKQHKKQEIQKLFIHILFEESKKHDKLVYDYAPPEVAELFKSVGKNLYVMFVYADFKTLAKNINRRRTTELRGLSVFEQYTKKYYTSDETDLVLDIVNKNKFKDVLETYLKYLFESQENLNLFVEKIFGDLGIIDDDDYKIGIKKEFDYAGHIITSNKSENEIENNLKNIFNL